VRDAARSNPPLARAGLIDAATTRRRKRQPLETAGMHAYTHMRTHKHTRYTLYSRITATRTTPLAHRRHRWEIKARDVCRRARARERGRERERESEMVKRRSRGAISLSSQAQRPRCVTLGNMRAMPSASPCDEHCAHGTACTRVQRSRARHRAVGLRPRN